MGVSFDKSIAVSRNFLLPRKESSEWQALKKVGIYGREDLSIESSGQVISMLQAIIPEHHETYADYELGRL